MDHPPENNQQCARSSRVRTWLDLVQDIYVTYFFCKALFYISLQLRYLHLQSKLEDPGALDLSDSSLVEQRVHELREMIKFSGLLLIEVGSPAILGYASSILIYIMFYVTSRSANFLFANSYRRDSLILLHLDPELSAEQFKLTSDRYLKELTVVSIQKLKTMAKFDYLSPISSKESKQIVADLTEQQWQLRDLLSDKSAIRPTNRCERWKQEQTKFVLRATISIFALVYVAISINVNVSALYSVNSMAQRDDKPNLLELLSIQEINFVIVPFTEAIMSPLVLLVFNLRDRQMSLRIMKQQFYQLNARLLELSSCQTNQSTKTIRLRSECSRKSLEIYLKLRFFMDELRSSAKLASFIASQYALYGFLLTVLILTIFPRSNSLELKLLFLLLMVMAVVINSSFLLCATIQSNCSKVVQLAWSLVAHTALRNHQALSKETNETMRALEQGYADSITGSFCHQSRLYKFDYLGVSMINEQTAQLWRRLVVDVQKVHDYFRFTALGLVELNYSGVLRLNFWFISMLLLNLTYRP